MWPLAPASAAKTHTHLAARQRELSTVVGAALTAADDSPGLASQLNTSSASTMRSQTSLSSRRSDESTNRGHPASSQSDLDLSSVEGIGDRLVCCPSIAGLATIRSILWPLAELLASVTLPAVTPPAASVAGNAASQVACSIPSQQAAGGRSCIGVPWAQRVHSYLQQHILEHEIVPGDGLQPLLSSRLSCNLSPSAAGAVLVQCAEVLYSTLTHLACDAMSSLLKACGQRMEGGQCERLWCGLQAATAAVSAPGLVQYVHAANAQHPSVSHNVHLFLARFLAKEGCQLKHLLVAAVLHASLLGRSDSPESVATPPDMSSPIAPLLGDADESLETLWSKTCLDGPDSIDDGSVLRMTLAVFNTELESSRSTANSQRTARQISTWLYRARDAEQTGVPNCSRREVAAFLFVSFCCRRLSSNPAGGSAQHLQPTKTNFEQFWRKILKCA